MLDCKTKVFHLPFDDALFVCIVVVSQCCLLGTTYWLSVPVIGSHCHLPRSVHWRSGLICMDTTSWFNVRLEVTVFPQVIHQVRTIEALLMMALLKL